MKWRWQFDQISNEWRFYPGTAKPHLRLRWLPGRSAEVWHLYGTFLSKEQHRKIGNFILSESPWLDGREILEVDEEMCK